MSQWIYCFRVGSKRELSSEERRQFRRRYLRIRWRVVGQCLLALLCVPLFVAGCSIAADSLILGWSIVIGSVVAGIWLPTWGSEIDKLGLAYRRAARLGIVRQWSRDIAPVTVRQAYGDRQFERMASGEEDDLDGDREEPSDYWLQEERFDRRLEHSAGKVADRFETVDEDGVVITVEGRPVRKIIQARIVQSP